MHPLLSAGWREKPGEELADDACELLALAGRELAPHRRDAGQWGG
jgi:hypothetical protein